jgi:hypothetical protein
MNNIVEKEIDGIVYKASFRGMAYAYSLYEKYQEKGRNLARDNELFREILVSPKVGIDDFSDITSYSKVRDFLLDVATGRYYQKHRTGGIKDKVRNQWGCWRLIYCDMANFTYDEVFYRMNPQEIEEANVALDIVQEQIKKQSKKKR